MVKTESNNKKKPQHVGHGKLYYILTIFQFQIHSEVREKSESFKVAPQGFCTVSKYCIQVIPAASFYMI